MNRERNTPKAITIEAMRKIVAKAVKRTPTMEEAAELVVQRAERNFPDVGWAAADTDRAQTAGGGSGNRPPDNSKVGGSAEDPNSRGIHGRRWVAASHRRRPVPAAQKGGEFDTSTHGIPRISEAERLLSEAGCRIDRRDIAGHAPGGVSTHTYPHFNYVTPTGVKGTIRVRP